MAELAQQSRLAHEALLVRRAGCAQELDRYRLITGSITGAIDRAHASGSSQGLQAEAPCDDVPHAHAASLSHESVRSAADGSNYALAACS
jgi:hypothetical protein